jgi:hypothetical protein
LFTSLITKDVFDELKFIPDPMLSIGMFYKYYFSFLKYLNLLVNSFYFFLLDLKHYKDFDELYGTETKEQLPSASDSTEEAIPTGVINNSNIRKFVNCTICNKPR